MSKKRKILFRVLALVLALSMCLAYVPPKAREVEANAAVLSETEIRNRIDYIANVFAGNKVFGVNPNAGCGCQRGHKSCSNCYNANVVNAQWFKNSFGNVQTSQFPTHYTLYSETYKNGWTCMGFANFAEWYIFRSSNADVVTTYKVGNRSYDYNSMRSTLRIGDVLRLDDAHSAIAIDVTAQGVYVLDCNWTNYGQLPSSVVQKHVIPYSFYNNVAVSRVSTSIGNPDSVKPVIKNAKITKRTSTGVTVECDVTDNVGVTSVRFPTWPTYFTDASKIIWFSPTSRSGNHYVLNFNINSYGNYRGRYATDIYAYDAANNWVAYRLVFDILSCDSPTISFSDVKEGKEVKIKGASSDTINYTILKDGAAYRSGTASGEYTETLKTEGKYSVSAYSSRTNYGNSQTIKSETSLTKAATPAVRSTLTENNIILDIESATKDAAIHYTTNGATPTISSQKYAGAIPVNSEKTIKAIAIKNGYINSDVMTYNVKLEEPGAPSGFVINDDGIVKDGKMAVGKQFSVKWDKTDNATSYYVELHKDGNKIKTVQTNGTAMSFTLDSAGKYQIHLYASNFVGNSEEAYPPIEIEAVDPSTVKFVDYDGSVIKEQKVAFGDDASAPEDPERRGYTFVSWKDIDKIEGVTEDLVITATYKINTYTVKFYDASGKQVGSTQKVDFGNSAVSPENDLTDIPTGYVFAGWKVLESANDSAGDYTNVDSDMKLQAVYYWGNKELPVYTEITSATRNSETGNYNIGVKLTNFPDDATTAILRVSLMTTEGKMVKTGKTEVEIPADKSIEESITLKYNGVATNASVVLLGLNGNDLTGSAYSREVTRKIIEQSDSTWSDWSEWSTDVIEATEDKEVESKTEYRYKEKETTTSTAASIDGWTKYDSTTTYGNWGAWSGFGPTAQSKSDTKDVQTKTYYRYYWYYCPACGRYEPMTGWSDCGRYNLTSANFNTTWIDYSYAPTDSHSFSYAPNIKYTDILVPAHRVCFAAGNLYDTAPGTKDANGSGATVIATWYSYRTRTKTITNYFYKWSDWSDWSENEITPSDNVEVETRTVYHERTKVPVYSELAGSEEEGKAYSFKGNLSSVAADLNGKLATILVYKGKNTDPNEDQIQYVGQTTIGENNSYDFTVIPKTEPTDLTGDFTVCLGLEGSTGLVMVGMIKAPKTNYIVKYLDDDGSVISEQEVEAGENAVVPTSPSKDGYVFVGWSANAMNVQSNMTINAVYNPLTYVVTFVDGVNCVVSYENYKYGDDIVAPSDPSAPGRTFKGWDILLEGKTKVTGNMVANAVYDTETFVVTFVDGDDKPLSKQIVDYGCSAMPPTAPEAVGKEFVGWSTSEEWWNVTKNMTVKPIFAYGETVESPTYRFIETDDKVLLELKTETAGADIYYMCADGKKTVETDEGKNGEALQDDDGYEYSEPVLYDGNPIELNILEEEPSVDDAGKTVFTSQARVKAYAVCPEMNDSCIQKILYQQEYTTSEEDPIECTVTFDPNGGKAIEDNTRTVKAGDFITDYPMPERDDFEFDGWYLEAAAENEFNGLDCVTEDITLYAGWKKAEVYYTISFDVNEGNPIEETTRVLSENEKIGTLPSVERDGFTFSGWYTDVTDGELVTEDTIFTGDKTLYARWISSEHVHDIVIDEAVEPTCTAPGKTEGSHCSICKEVIIAQQEIKPLGHDFNNYVYNNDATCAKDGTETSKCSRCEEKDTRTAEGTATGIHDWGEYVVTTEPKCNSLGVKTRVCKVCGKKSTEGIPKLKHNYVEEIQQRATCEEEGIKKLVCTLCGDEKYESIDKCSHTEVDIPAKDATCTKSGLTKGKKCSECGRIIVPQNVVDALGHDYTSQITKDATCTEKGVKTYTCTRCSKTYTEEIPMKAHTVVIDPKVEATTSSTGLTEGKHCSVCGKIIEEQEVIPKLEKPDNTDQNKNDSSKDDSNKDNSSKDDASKNDSSKDDVSKNDSSKDDVIKDDSSRNDSIKNDTSKNDSNKDYNDKNSSNNSGSNDNGSNGSGSSGQGSDKKIKANKLEKMALGTVYYKADGSKAKSEWIKIDGVDYYFNSDGYAAKDEWRDGKWISSDGSCTYSGQLIWKSNSTGWWVEDTEGWYPTSSWQKIDGIWYYFNPSGYMASGEYYDGYWFNADGSWDENYYLTWKNNSTGWWVEDKSGWWPSSSWLKIDGYWYYFDGSGYMVTNQYIDGYWLGNDGVCY